MELSKVFDCQTFNYHYGSKKKASAILSAVTIARHLWIAGWKARPTKPHWLVWTKFSPSSNNLNYSDMKLNCPSLLSKATSVHQLFSKNFFRHFLKKVKQLGSCRCIQTDLLTDSARRWKWLSWSTPFWWAIFIILFLCQIYLFLSIAIITACLEQRTYFKQIKKMLMSILLTSDGWWCFRGSNSVIL